jgi:hypothetical protein
LEAQVIRLASLPALMPLGELVARLDRLLGQNPAPRPQQLAPPPVAAPIKPPTATPPTGPAPPTDWPGFLRHFAKELGSSAILLKGAQARQWGPKTVEIVLALDGGEAAAPHLSAILAPLLEKVWGGRPELIINGGQSAKPEILKALEAAPDLQELQAALPGKFIGYRPHEPAEDTKDDNEEETADEPDLQDDD